MKNDKKPKRNPSEPSAGDARRKRQEPPPPASPSPAVEDPAGYSPGVGGIVREWFDALVFAFMLAMFVRVFVVELFKIPTGSMTPTLIGDYVAEEDLDGDSVKDLVVRGASQNLVFMNKGDHYVIDDETNQRMLGRINVEEWAREGRFKPQYDRILVNKFAFWFSPPSRGDVVVFKVPEIIWDPNKPIYIKRAVGLPGEEIEFDGRLKAGGAFVEDPPFFQRQEYQNLASDRSSGFERKDYVEYGPRGYGPIELTKVRVPEDGVFVLGDNTRSSLDSRYWGAVPVSNLKGKAFMRYWPFSKIKFIR